MRCCDSIKKRSFHFPELLSSSWLWEILLFLTNSPSRTDPAAEAKRKENVICGWYICLLIVVGCLLGPQDPRIHDSRICSTGK
jgi:hypothetical protein